MRSHHGVCASRLGEVATVEKVATTAGNAVTEGIGAARKSATQGGIATAKGITTAGEIATKGGIETTEGIAAAGRIGTTGRIAAKGRDRVRGIGTTGFR